MDGAAKTQHHPPFLRSREEIKRSYGKALRELALSIGREGKRTVGSVAVAAKREFDIEVREKSIWSLRYKDIAYHDAPVRHPDKRGYDEYGTTPHLEEGIALFEKLLENMLQIAEFESKLKRLGEEIVKTTRRIKVLEEMVLPALKHALEKTQGDPSDCGNLPRGGSRGG